ncbi:MAG: hybrid sensor histidine kinase/response regulator, partial [Phototrophicales bacterium]
LGLSVVYGIVKQHKGIIHVDSTLGKGTAFKLYFPVKNVSKTSRVTKEEEMTNLCGTETILVVEDDSAVRKVALRILSGMGYKTLTAANGMEALKIFERKKDEIDLVVMDVVMPKFSGPDTYRKLSRVRPHLPVIFVTGYDVNSEIKDSDFME